MIDKQLQHFLKKADERNSALEVEVSNLKTKNNNLQNNITDISNRLAELEKTNGIEKQ